MEKNSQGKKRESKKEKFIRNEFNYIIKFLSAKKEAMCMYNFLKLP